MLRAAGQEGSLSAAHPQRPASAPIPALARYLVGFFPVYRAVSMTNENCALLTNENCTHLE